MKNIFRVSIAYKPPCDWKSLLHYYAMHQIPFVEEVSDSHYQKVFKMDSSIGLFSVEDDVANAQILLEVHCQDPKVLSGVVERVTKMFDLAADPNVIQHHFSAFPFLKDLWQEFPGLRMGRGWNAYEIAIGTILGQVVSVKQAAKLMGDVVKHYGEKVTHPITKEETFLFPAPEVLAIASLEEIKTTTQRKNAIRELSQKIIDKEMSLDENQDPENFKKQLREIKGIGHWSAEYISLRGLGDKNAFPKDDLILKRALALNNQHYDLNQLKPWLGYLAIYLWRKYAETLSKTKRKKEKS